MIAVIGCGNPNRCDDGAGPEVVRRLVGHGGCADERVRLLDAGTDGMAVMFAARGASTLIVIDACRSGSDAGAVFELDGGRLEQPHQPSFTLHDFRWEHALYAGRRMFRDAFPRDVVVELIEVGTVEFGVGLSPRVDTAVDIVAGRVEELIRSRLAAEGPEALAPVPLY